MLLNGKRGQRISKRLTPSPSESRRPSSRISYGWWKMCIVVIARFSPAWDSLRRLAPVSGPTRREWG